MITSTIQSVISADLHTVWKAVTSLDDCTWRSDLSCIEIHDDKSFTEYTTRGIGTRFTVTTQKPYSLYEFDMENNNLSGHWTGLFRQTERGTEVIFSETVRVKRWWMRPLAKPYLKKQQARYVTDLKRKCEPQ